MSLVWAPTSFDNRKEDGRCRNVIKLKRNVISLHPEVHDVASPPALEESPGVWGASKRPSVSSRSCHFGAQPPLVAALSAEMSLGTFRRWKVPRRRLLRKRFVRRGSIRFAYLVRTSLYQSERGIVQNPLFQPHIFFSSHRKENVPLTVQKIGAAAPCVAQPPLAAALGAEQRAVGGAAEEWFALPRTPC